MGEGRWKVIGHDWIPVHGKFSPREGRGRSIEVNWEVGKAERERKSPSAAPGTFHDYHDLFCSVSKISY